MDEKQAAALRKQFPKTAIGQLPKGGTMLDYVGHAVTTDRLLTVDPEWTWEPMATDEFGNPQPDAAGNLWIRLTVCGVTRIGCGDGPSMKVRIGDAIRNAAMRFGVALDLWTKEELEGEPSEHREPEKKAERVKGTEEDNPFYDTPPTDPLDQQVSAKTNAHMFALFAKKGPLDAESQLAGVNQINGTAYTSRAQITERAALATIAVLKKRPDLEEPS